MLIRKKTYNSLIEKINKLTDMYYLKDDELAEYRLKIIELRNVFDNKKLDTSDKKINRIKKILRGKNENKTTKDN